MTKSTHLNAKEEKKRNHIPLIFTFFYSLVAVLKNQLSMLVGCGCCLSRLLFDYILALLVVLFVYGVIVAVRVVMLLVIVALFSGLYILLENVIMLMHVFFLLHNSTICTVFVFLCSSC